MDVNFPVSSGGLCLPHNNNGDPRDQNVYGYFGGGASSLPTAVTDLDQYGFAGPFCSASGQNYFQTVAIDHTSGTQVVTWSAVVAGVLTTVAEPTDLEDCTSKDVEFINATCFEDAAKTRFTRYTITVDGIGIGVVWFDSAGFSLATAPTGVTECAGARIPLCCVCYMDGANSLDVTWFDDGSYVSVNTATGAVTNHPTGTAIPATWKRCQRTVVGEEKVTFTSATAGSLTIPAGANHAEIHVWDSEAIWSYAGTADYATKNGVRENDGARIELEGFEEMDNFNILAHPNFVGTACIYVQYIYVPYKSYAND